MKSILYLGVLLMASAAIYGFVDYERSGGQPTFDKLYSEEPMPVAQEVPAPPSKPLIENVVFTQPEITPEMSKLKSLLQAVKESVVTEKKKKKKERKIDYESFSRAPLREIQEIDEIPKTEPAPVKLKSVQ